MTFLPELTTCADWVRGCVQCSKSSNNSNVHHPVIIIIIIPIRVVLISNIDKNCIKNGFGDATHLKCSNNSVTNSRPWNKKNDYAIASGTGKLISFSLFFPYWSPGAKNTMMMKLVDADDCDWILLLCVCSGREWWCVTRSLSISLESEGEREMCKEMYKSELNRLFF